MEIFMGLVARREMGEKELPATPLEAANLSLILDQITNECVFDARVIHVYPRFLQYCIPVPTELECQNLLSDRCTSISQTSSVRHTFLTYPNPCHNYHNVILKVVKQVNNEV